MSKAVVNQFISIDIPEGFHAMSAEELRQAYRDGNPNRWGMWDKERHVMVTIMWKDYPRLMKLLMLDLKAVCQKNEQMAAKGYAGNSYECGGFFSPSVDGKPAEGYRFSYRVGDAEQSAETILFRQDMTVYSITLAGRTENREADRSLFDGIVVGISFQ